MQRFLTQSKAERSKQVNGFIDSDPTKISWTYAD